MSDQQHLAPGANGAGGRSDPSHQAMMMMTAPGSSSSGGGAGRGSSDEGSGSDVELAGDICHRTRLCEQLEQLLVTGSFSDTVLLVDGHRFKVHRAILAARSEYFRKFNFFDVNLDADHSVLTGALKWRKFNFFDVNLDADHSVLTGALKDDGRVTCVTSGGGHLVVGDSAGSLHVLSRRWSVVSRRVFDSSVSCVYQVKQTNTLIAVGEDESGVSSLKIFSLDGASDGVPSFQRQIRLPAPTSVLSPVSVTSVCVDEQRLFMCVGFVDGRVALWRGDVCRERCGKSQILHSGQWPITGLGFHYDSGQYHVFVATTHSVLCYNITNRSKQQQTILDKSGCNMSCAVMTQSCQNALFTVANADSIKCYNTTECVSQFLCEGEKRLIYWFKSHLITISASQAADCVLHVYDVNNEYVAMTSSELGALGHVVGEWGRLFVIACDARLHSLVEHTLRAKLNVLFSRNFYDVGIRLAQSENYCSDQLVDIFREYGDHLYEQGNHMAAVEQYVKTIGSLPPSYVIRKYLDSQRVSELSEYLRAVHGTDSGTEDITALLINCYVKLRDIKRLDLLIQDDSLVFDVAAAVEVCRCCGLPRQAVALARRRGLHLKAVTILLDDIREPAEVLEYIEQLGAGQSEQLLMKYGVRLLEQKPEQTLQLLISICTRLTPDDQFCVADFVNLLTAHPSHQLHLLQHLYQANSELIPADLLLTLLELYLSSYTTCVQDAAGETGSAQLLERGALALLQDKRLDTSRALQLCQIHDFNPGRLMLYSTAGLFEESLQEQLDCGDFGAAVTTCKQYGVEKKDATLWLRTLEAMCLHPQPPQPLISEVLLHLSEGGQASLIQVLDILVGSGDDSDVSGDKYGALSLSTVRQFLCSAMTAEQEEIRRHVKAAETLATESDQLKQHISQEVARGKVFQRTNCAVCGGQLELPLVHFFCSHSFHVRCLQSTDRQDDHCPRCQPEHDALIAQLKNQAEDMESEATLFSRLQSTEDVFAVVTDYISRGAIPSRTIAVDSSTKNSQSPDKSTATRKGGDVKNDFSDLFGAMSVSDAGDTEAKIRVADPRSRSNVLDIIPEGRMRTAERIASEVKIRAQQQPIRTRPLSTEVKTGLSDNTPQQRHLPTNTRTSPQAATKSASNPFDDQNKSPTANPFDDRDYDSAKNPFGDENYDQSKNPFEEQQGNQPGHPDSKYDDTLNPFA